MWTREKPTQDGYYWLNSGTSAYQGVVRVEYETPDSAVVTFLGDESCPSLSHVEDEWFGPIEEPKGEQR